MAETQRLEMGHDREPAEFANRLREVASEIDNGGVLYGFHESESVDAEDPTRITISFTYTPTA